MITIAIVEDTDADANALESFIKRFEDENKVTFLVTRFPDAIHFIDDTKTQFDIIFMDIEMPGMDGMEAAKKLRTYNEKALLIFITYFKQYAIQGYSVNAFDFVPKPLDYSSFSTMFKRAITKTGYEKKTEIVIKPPYKIIKIDILSVIYVEVVDHRLTYHTDSGEYSEWGSLKNIIPTFENHGFGKTSHYCLVNFRRIRVVEGNDITLVDDTHLFISRSQKTEFAKEFAQYMLWNEG